MLPRLPGKRLLFRLNAAPVHANHANRASAFAVSRIIDPSRLADPKAFVNPDYFASDSTKPDYALVPVIGGTMSKIRFGNQWNGLAKWDQLTSCEHEIV